MPGLTRLVLDPSEAGVSLPLRPDHGASTLPMKSYCRLFLLLALFIFPGLPRLVAQEAVEITADSSPEPTPIEEATPTPKKKPKAKAEPQEAESSKKDIENMSPDDFKKAGLDKLSPEELRSLNEWMKGYRQQAEKKAATQATEQTREQAKQEAKKSFNRSWISTDRIYSRIDGEFHGIQAYKKKAIIRLEDGTVWKQANESDHCEAQLTDHPPVMVTHSAVGYKMHVIGAGEFYVNPVREKK